MRTLYTAFKGKNNTSYQLVTALNKPFVLLTNSFQGVKRDIENIDAHYNAIIMIGVDKGLNNCIRFEKCAECNGEMLNTDFAIDTLTQKCDKMEIPYHVSVEPTKFLCNRAYWHMLRKNPNTIFVHIPSVGKMDPEFLQSLTYLLSQ